MSKILFIGAHYDDIELSCGGTIVKMLEQGHELGYVGLSRCRNKSLQDECRASLAVLGIKECVLEDLPYRTFDQIRQDILDLLIEIRDNFKPDIIFTHSATDRHQDHAAVGQESLRAFRECTLITYCNHWNKTSEAKQDNYFVQLHEEIHKKAEALKCYISQKDRKYMKPSILFASLKFTGSIIGVDYAESFFIERYVQ